MAAPRNPNTAPARIAKKGKARERADASGTLEQLQARVWSAINRIDEIINNEVAEPALVLRASHALFQGAAAFSKVIQAGELEARLEALEKPSSSDPDAYFEELQD